MNINYSDAIKATNPTATLGEVAKLLSQQWKTLTDEEKKPYYDSEEKVIKNFCVSYL